MSAAQSADGLEGRSCAPVFVVHNGMTNGGAGEKGRLRCDGAWVVRSTDRSSVRSRRLIYHLIPGAVALAALFAGMVTSLPPPPVVHAHTVGIADQRSGRLQAAAAEYRAVLKYDPSAAFTRGELACVLWRQGKKALAAEEVYRAAVQGWIPWLQGACGGGVNLGLAFTTAPIGWRDILVIYKSPGSQGLVDIARDTRLPWARRIAAAACLGMNANFVAFGVEPISESSDLGVAGGRLLGALRGCLGSFSHWFQCSPWASDNCVLQFGQEMVRRQELAYVGIGGG